MTDRLTFALSARANWRLTLSIAVFGILISPSAWPWVLLVAIIVPPILRYLFRIALDRQAARIHLAAYGSFSATATTLSYTQNGRTVSIKWDDVQSLAFGEDPLSQQNEWQLRASEGMRGDIEIPDHPWTRRKLLQYFASYLPDFDSNATEQAVSVALAKHEDVFVECWRRTPAAT